LQDGNYKRRKKIMGRFGWHSGRGAGKSLQADDKYVNNSIILWAGDFSVDKTIYSATTDLLETHGDMLSAYFCISGVVGTKGIETPTLAFDDGTDHGAGFGILVPTGIPESTRADIRVCWTTSGANSRVMMSGVVWDVDYRSVPVVLSGQNASVALQMSGSVSNATATGQWVMTRDSVSSGRAGVMSGIITNTTISIPSTGFGAGDLIQCVLYRDTGETSDDLLLQAHIVAVAVEFV